MKRKSTCWLFTWYLILGTWGFGFSQSIAPTAVNSTGNYSTAAFGSISSSVGEPMTTTTPLVGGIQLTQGFQQPQKKNISSYI